MTENRSNPLWNVLKSVKLTLTLLIIIAVTSIMGTLIPQQEGALEFAKVLSPGMVRLFSALQLFDMYHSIWFRLIICFLSLNLIVCSIDRFPATLKRFTAKPRPDRSKPFEDLPENRSFTASGEKQEVSAQVAYTLEKQYGKVQIKISEKGDFFYSEKGGASLFGVYLVHLSVLLILIGSIIGSLFGFEAFVNIAEGESINTVTLRNSMNHAHEELGFNVQCEDFSVDFYENGAPKEYISELNFIFNGETVKQKTLKVNHPAKFNGIRFYQSSYGTIPGEKISIRVTKSGDKPVDRVFDIKAGELIPLPDDDAPIIITDIKEDFMRMGPAVQIIVKPPGNNDIRLWLFKNMEIIKARMPGMFDQFPTLNPSAYKPYTFHLNDLETRYYTGLQVNKDPGVGFVYAGFIMIIIGLYITFFTSHRRIWIRAIDEDGKTTVSLTGTASKNPVGMDRELDQLKVKLMKKLNMERTS